LNFAPVCEEIYLTIDNGVMIAWCGIEKFDKRIHLVSEKEDVIDIKPRWPLDTL
jgi:tRNA A37 threonylcarbamoyltransferase TsaD